MRFLFLALFCGLVMLPAPVQAAATPKALVLTVFGTSTEATVTFDELLPLVQKRFPDRTVVVPYTSGVIRKKLNAAVTDPARKILSPAEMLAKLKAEGYRDIAVVSTILFAGVEHAKLQKTVEEFAATNPEMTLRYVPPLLAEEANLKAVVGMLGTVMLPSGSNIVVAHGTHQGHPVEATYRELAALTAVAYPNARVGSVEGVPDMQTVLDWVKGRPGKDVRFVVFMFVAGDHAENDIAANADDSLFSAVRKMGKTPSVAMVSTPTGSRMASLGLNPAYRQLLLDYYAKNLSQ